MIACCMLYCMDRQLHETLEYNRLLEDTVMRLGHNPVQAYTIQHTVLLIPT